MQPSYTNYTVISRKAISVPMNKVLRNTYLLLSLTIMWSATTAGLALSAHAAPPGIFMTIIGMFGLILQTKHIKTPRSTAAARHPMISSARERLKAARR